MGFQPCWGIHFPGLGAPSVTTSGFPKIYISNHIARACLSQQKCVEFLRRHAHVTAVGVVQRCAPIMHVDSPFSPPAVRETEGQFFRSGLGG